MTKPKGSSNIAYQYWGNILHTKPVDNGSIWTDCGGDLNGNGRLFVWANNTGIHCNGRTLVWMKDVGVGGTDDKIDMEIFDME